MRLKDLREDHDLKQSQIATFLNVQQNTYSQYENGERQIPVDSLIKLSQFYAVSVDYLLGLTSNSSPYQNK